MKTLALVSLLLAFLVSSAALAAQSKPSSGKGLSAEEKKLVEQGKAQHEKMKTAPVASQELQDKMQSVVSDPPKRKPKPKKIVTLPFPAKKAEPKKAD